MPCQWSSSSSGDPASTKASLGAGSSALMLAGLHADLRNIAPAQLFVCITTIHKRFIYKAYHIIKILLVVNILMLLF